MQAMIESIESRRLLSASVSVIAEDFKVLKSDAATIQADLASGLATIGADGKALKGAYVAAHPVGTQKRFAASLLKEKALATNAFNREINPLIASGKQYGNRLKVLLKSLEAHPTNATLQVRVAAAARALAGVLSSQKLAMVESIAQSGVSNVESGLNALAAAIPSTQAQVATAEADLGTISTTLSDELSTVQTDAATLASDAA